MRVVFSGSIRYHNEMLAWAKFLETQDIQVDLPEPAANFDQLSDHEQRRLKRSLIERHNRLIDDCSMLFVFNPDGRVGNSVTLEIGYAQARGKPIYALHLDDELGRDVLYHGYCGTPKELLKSLKEFKPV